MADKKISALPTGVNIGPLDLIPYVDTTAAPIETKHIQWGSAILPYIGGYAPIDVTYAQLYNDVVNATLTPLQWYRLTDYKSVNYLNGYEIAESNPVPTDPDFTPREVYVGSNEVLLLQAVSPDTISSVGYSESFPQDIIQYQPLVNKIGLPIELYNGNTLPNGITVIAGFDLQWDGTNVYFNMPTGYPALYGHQFYIYCEFDGGNYYQDGNFEPLLAGDAVAQYPFSSNDPLNNYPKQLSRIRLENGGLKVVLVDLTNADFLDYDVDTLYVETIYAIDNAYGWVTRRKDTVRNIDVPFDFRHRTYRRFEVDLSAISTFGVGYYGIGDNFLGQGTTGNYADFKSIDNESYDCLNMLWSKTIGGPDVVAWYTGDNDNNVFKSNKNVTILSDVVNNNTADFMGSVFITSDIFSNNIGNYAYSNISSHLHTSNILNISNSTISARTSSFINNKMTQMVYTTVNCSNFTGNLINNNFSNNIINGDYFSNILSTFSYNTIGGAFYGNTGNGSVSNCTFTVGGDNNDIKGSIAECNLYLFSNNTINPVGFAQFQFVDASYPILGINFNLANHVYAGYTKQLIRRSNNTTVMSYVDGSNNVQYVAPNA